MKLFRKSEALLKRPLWQKILIAVSVVVGDVLVSLMRLADTDASVNRMLVTAAVMVGTWMLLPFALRHAARERDPRSTQPGPRLSLIHISEPTRRLRGSRMPSSA